MRYRCRWLRDHDWLRRCCTGIVRCDIPQPAGQRTRQGGRYGYSSALNEPDSWAEVTIGKLATELAKPFGIAVVDESGDTEPFHLAKIQPGETAFEILERYSRQRGVLSISDGKGAVLLAKPGQKRADVALEQGKNIKAANGTADYSQ